MQWVATMFQQGGPTMFWILMLIIPSLALVGVHIGMRRRWSLWASVGAIALILGIGLYGMMWGRSRTDAMLGDVESKSIREAGYDEASRPMEFAGLVTVVLFAGVLVAQLRRRELR